MGRISIEEAKEKHEDRIMAMAGVIGMGIGLQQKKPCIVIYLKKVNRETLDAIPKKIEEYPVKVEISDEFVAL